MGAKLTFQIASKLDGAGFKDAAAQVRGMGTEMEEAGVAANYFKESIQTLQAELVGMVAIMGVINFFRDMITMTAEGQEAMGLLGSKVESVGQDFNKNRPQVDAFTTALSEQTRFTKTQYLDALGIAVAKVHDLGTAENLATIAAGYAVEKHLDLATAMDIVAGSAANQNKSTLRIIKDLGLAKGLVTDHAEVMRILGERYARSAIDSKEFIDSEAELANQFANQKKIIGDDLLPIWAAFAAILMTAWSTVKMIVLVLADAARLLMPFIAGINTTKDRLKAFSDEVAKEWGAKGKLPTALAAGKIAIAEALEQTQDIIQKFRDQEVAAALEGEDKKAKLLAVKRTQEEQALKVSLTRMGESEENIALAINAMKASFRAEDLADADKRHKEAVELIEKYNDQAMAYTLGGEDKKLQLMEFQHTKELEQLKKHIKDMSAADQSRIIAADNAAYEKAVTAEKFATMNRLTGKGLDEIAKATQAFIRGDKAAWTSLGNSVIQTAAQEVQSVIKLKAAEAMASSYAAGALIGGPVGGAIAAAETGLYYAGLSALVGVGAGILGNVVNGGPSGDSSASSSSSAATVSTATGSGATSPAPSDSGKAGLNLTIMIDQMIGDSAYVDSLVQKISDRVERNDMRLVATSVKT